MNYKNIQQVTAGDTIILSSGQFQVASVIDGFKTVRKIVLDAPGPKSERTLTYKLDASVRVAN